MRSSVIVIYLSGKFKRNIRRCRKEGEDLREDMVTQIPNGILSCFLEGKETGIVGLGTNRLRIRWPEQLDRKPMRIKIVYYRIEQGIYENICMEPLAWDVEEECRFHWEYEFVCEDISKVYHFVIRQYYAFIMEKMESVGGEFSETYAGYPAAQDEELHNSYEEWLEEQYKQNQVDKIWEISKELQLECAITLDCPKAYRMFLEGRLPKKDRIYIGNAYCHNLFPDKKTLLALMEKAYEQQIGITIVFSYLRDNGISQVREQLDGIQMWAKMKNCPKQKVELEINDWGMLPLLENNCEHMTILWGTLINRQRKDPRYPYKKGFQEKHDLLKENQLQQEELIKYLKGKNVQRYEYESCGYELQLVKHSSLHIPMYQTNTSQYCPLAALWKYQDRSKQQLQMDCERYCEKVCCTYPKHLHMIGKYNSLFGWDTWLLEHPKILETYKEQGLERIVWNVPEIWLR